MARRIYKKRTGSLIKVRLQHTAENNELSPVLERIDELIDKSNLYSYARPRLGTNPKYAGQQATAIYMEVDADTLLKMFKFLTLSTSAA